MQAASVEKKMLFLREELSSFQTKVGIISEGCVPEENFFSFKSVPCMKNKLFISFLIGIGEIRKNCVTQNVLR